MIKIELERVEGDYGFRAKDERGHAIHFDTSDENGGTNFGVRPMQSLLMALGSCSGIDIVSILKKQKQEFSFFAISIEGEREQSKTVSLWTKINVEFRFKGLLDYRKAYKACQLSIEKYCSVAETLRRAGAEINWKLSIESL